jgi:hypothetical protein
MVFVYNHKFFKEPIKNDLIYVFNSQKLYENLSKNHRCVNLNKNGDIANENFFPKEKIKIHSTIYQLKKDVYSYLKEYFHKLELKYKYSSSFKDAEFKDVIKTADNYLKKGELEAIQYINGENLRLLVKIIQIMRGKTFYNGNRITIGWLLVYINSFYRSYLYSMIDKPGIDAFSEKLQYDLSLNIIKNHFHKNITYKDGFHFNYLKLLSKLFLEHVQKNRDYLTKIKV